MALTAEAREASSQDDVVRILGRHWAHSEGGSGILGLPDDLQSTPLCKLIECCPSRAPQEERVQITIVLVNHWLSRGTPSEAMALLKSAVDRLPDEQSDTRETLLKRMASVNGSGS